VRSTRPLVCLAWLAALAGCHEPYHPPPPTDMAVQLPTMVWGHGAGMPLGMGRAGMPLVLATANSTLVGFGGSPTSSSDTWSFSLHNDAWSTLILPAAPPPGRTGHCAAYLPPQNSALFIGGHDDAGQPQTTPMTLTIGTPAYVEVTGAGPQPTAGCAAAFSPPAERVVVFGGLVGGAPSPSPSDDTWLFDGVASSFAPAAPAHRPPARSGGALVADPGAISSDARLLLFGGLGIGGELADVWLWDGSDWGELGTSADPDAPTTDDPRPLGRSDAAVALDPTRRALYVFGGARLGALLDDLWRLDLRTLTWSRLHPAGGGPAARAQASAAYDPVLDRMLIFGGRGEAGPLADGWSLAPAP
jgi:hypothetical protein